MILSFKTQIKGKPTHFVDRILAKTKIHTIRSGERWKAGNTIHMATGVRTKNYAQFNKAIDQLSLCKSVQTIVINRVDYIPIDYHDGKVFIVDYNSEKETYQMFFVVSIAGRTLKVEEITQLAINDGFLSPSELFEWFEYKDFKGQLIHWTDLKY